MAEETENMNNGGAESQDAAVANTAETVAETAQAEPENWRSGLSAELRDSRVLAKYDSAEGAFKALIGAQELLGRKGLVAPVDGATQEQIDAYRAARRGGVDKAEAYTMKVAEKALSEVGLGENEIGSFKQQAFAAGLDNDAFNALMGEVVKERQQIFAAQREAGEALRDKLVSEWGGEAEAERRFERGAAFLRRFDGLSELVDASGLGSNEAFIRFIDEVSAKHFGERTLPKTQRAETVNPLDRIKELRDSNVFEKYDSPERSVALDDYKKQIEAMRQKSLGAHGRIIL